MNMACQISEKPTDMKSRGGGGRTGCRMTNTDPTAERGRDL